LDVAPTFGVEYIENAEFEFRISIFFFTIVFFLYSIYYIMDLCYNHKGDCMDGNQKKFGLYVFLSTFARNLIEVFIPIILYKFGFSLKEVILYYLLVNMFSLILSYPCVYISSKYNNKVLGIIGIISFLLVQLLLNFIYKSTVFLIIISLAYSLYRRGYWISRRFYNLRVMRKKNISSTYSFISIINHVGVVFSTYIGSLLLDFVTVRILTVISMFLFSISLIPLYLLNFEHNEKKIKLEPFKIIKLIPKKNIFLFGTYELINVIKFLFTMYLFLYVKDNYQTIGILNIFTNLSTIIFAHFYGKMINKEKNFLRLSILLVVVVYFFKLNSISYILILISFLEGLFNKMYEISIQKEFYLLSKNFEYNNYNLMYEITQNFFRTVMVTILYFFINDLRFMIIVVLLFISIGSFLKFNNSLLVNYNQNNKET